MIWNSETFIEMILVINIVMIIIIYYRIRQIETNIINNCCEHYNKLNSPVITVEKLVRVWNQDTIQKKRNQKEDGITY